MKFRTCFNSRLNVIKRESAAILPAARRVAELGPQNQHSPNVLHPNADHRFTACCALVLTDLSRLLTACIPTPRRWFYLLHLFLTFVNSAVNNLNIGGRVLSLAVNVYLCSYTRKHGP